MYTVGVLAPVMPSSVTDGDTSVAMARRAWEGFMVHNMKWSRTVADESLALFNDIFMLLALYLTKAFPAGTTLAGPRMAVVWTIVSGYIGAVLGWFNIEILLPRSVSS